MLLYPVYFMYFTFGHIRWIPEYAFIYMKIVFHNVTAVLHFLNSAIVFPSIMRDVYQPYARPRRPAMYSSYFLPLIGSQ